MGKIVLVLFALLFVDVFWGQGDVLADGDDLVLSGGIKEEYQDNLFFDEDNKVDDYITTFSAGIEGRKRSERLEAGLKGLFDAVVYKDNDDLNNLDQYYEGYVNYLLSERFSFDGEVSYKYDSRPDRDVDETGLLLGTNIRKTKSYDGLIDYDLTELSTVSLGYTYSDEDYEADIADDYDTHSVISQWKHDIGYWLDGARSRATFGYSRYNYRFTKTDNYQATLGIEQELTEFYSFYFDLGGRYSRYKVFEEQDLNLNDDGVGGVFKARLKYRGEYSTTNISIGHDISPASGRGRTLERTYFIGDLAYQLSGDITGRLRGGYYWNRGDLDADPFDERTIRVEPQLIYRFANNMQISASYSYTWVDRRDENIDKDRNVFYIRYTLSQNFFD